MAKVSLDKKILFSLIIALSFAFHASYGSELENSIASFLASGENQSPESENPLKIEHVTEVEPDEPEEENEDDSEAEEDETSESKLKDEIIEKGSPQNSSAEGNGDLIEDQVEGQLEEQAGEAEIEAESGIESGEKPEADGSNVTEPVSVESPGPPKLEAPVIPPSRTKLEEESLKKVVHELQYGSLLNSISLLENMVRAYPYDPDYKELLNAALNLREADIWYQYQRRLQLPPPSAQPKVIYKLIKMPRHEKPINELKQAGWYQLIKNKNRLRNIR